MPPSSLPKAWPWAPMPPRLGSGSISTTPRRVVLPTGGIMEPEGDGTLMRIGGEVDWIARYLAGLPCRFTVLEPDELRQALSELAAQLQSDASS